MKYHYAGGFVNGGCWLTRTEILPNGTHSDTVYLVAPALDPQTATEFAKAASEYQERGETPNDIEQAFLMASLIQSMYSDKERKADLN